MTPRRTSDFADFRRSRGFSVLELLLASSILSLIVFGLYQVFHQTQKALHANVTQVDVQEGGRAAMDFLVRDLEQTTSCNLSNGVNVWVNNSPVGRPITMTTLDTNVFRTNFFDDLFFLSKYNKDWTGTGYRVLLANPTNGFASYTNFVGVGSLWRYTATTNSMVLTSNNLLQAFVNASPTNMQRVTDGVVGLRLIPLDSFGRVQTTNPPNLATIPPWLISITTNRLDRLPVTFAYYTNALPAYIDLELAVLEPPTLDLFRSIPNAQSAANFLSQQAARVQLFRQRIPLRSSAQ